MLIRPGDPAPGFELMASDGQPHSLEDYRGRSLVLVFHRHLG